MCACTEYLIMLELFATDINEAEIVQVSFLFSRLCLSLVAAAVVAQEQKINRTFENTHIVGAGARFDRFVRALI